MNDPLHGSGERELRAGERVCLGGRFGVIRYLYGNGAAVVRFDHEARTKVVPVHRLVAANDECRVPDR
jgi:hypothetical protein